MISAVNHLTSLIRKNQKLVLINGFPTLDSNPIRMNHSFVKTSNHEFQVMPKNRNAEIIHQIMKGKENVYYYDINKSKLFRKAPYINDTIMYYDNVHINTFGSEKLAKDLDGDFMKFLKMVRSK